MPRFYIDMIDVGQGDAFVIAVPDSGTVVLVDAGPAESGAIVAAHIKEHFGTLDALIITHVDDDHVGGIEALLDAGIVPEEVYYNDPRDVAEDVRDEGLLKQAKVIVSSVRSATSGIEALQDAGAVLKNVFARESLRLSSRLSLRVLSPAKVEFSSMVRRFTTRNQRQLFEKRAGVSAENQSSVVFDLLWRTGKLQQRAALFTGDADAATLMRVSAHSYRWVKVPHHGSAYNCTEALVARWCGSIGPYAALSVGEDNRHGHPDPEVLAWFEKYGAVNCCTKCHSTLRFSWLGASFAAGSLPHLYPCECGWDFAI